MEEFFYLLEKFSKELNIPKKDLLDLIDKKKREYEGMLTDLAALYLVVAELGYRPAITSARNTLMDIAPGKKYHTIQACALSVPEEKDGKFRFKVYDGTVPRYVVVHGDVEIPDINVGDVIVIKNARCLKSKGDLILYVGKEGRIEKDAKYVPSHIKDLVGGLFAEIHCIVLYISHGSFNYCPYCGKKVEKECSIHGVAENRYYYRFILEDHTDIINAVYFTGEELGIKECIGAVVKGFCSGIVKRSFYIVSIEEKDVISDMEKEVLLKVGVLGREEEL